MKKLGTKHRKSQVRKSQRRSKTKHSKTKRTKSGQQQKRRKSCKKSRKKNKEPYRGVHYIYDFVNIKIKNTKDYNKKMNKILDQIIEECELNQIDKSNNLFKKENRNTPPGFAIVRVLDESHISAHSYSDVGILAVDIFTCGNLINGKKAGELLKKLVIKNFDQVIIKNEFIINRFPYNN